MANPRLTTCAPTSWLAPWWDLDGNDVETLVVGLDHPVGLAVGEVFAPVELQQFSVD